MPESWRRIEATGALLAFRDDARRATVAVNGRCGLDGDDVPLEALTHHLFLQFTERELVSQNRVDLDGREALRTEIVAKLDGVKKHYVVYVLKKDGCVYDFVYVSPGADAGEAGVRALRARLRNAVMTTVRRGTRERSAPSLRPSIWPPPPPRGVRRTRSATRR